MHHFHCWFRKEENLAVVTVLFMHYACVLKYIHMYKHNMYIMYIHSVSTQVYCTCTCIIVYTHMALYQCFLSYGVLLKLEHLKFVCVNS